MCTGEIEGRSAHCARAPLAAPAISALVTPFSLPCRMYILRVQSSCTSGPLHRGVEGVAPPWAPVALGLISPGLAVSPRPMTATLFCFLLLALGGRVLRRTSSVPSLTVHVRSALLELWTREAWPPGTHAPGSQGAVASLAGVQGAAEGSAGPAASLFQGSEEVVQEELILQLTVLSWVSRLLSGTVTP